MPNGWTKFTSLHCKSKAFDDVHDFNSYSCRKSSLCVKDVIDTRVGKKNLKPDAKLRRLKSCRTEPELHPPTLTRRSKSARTSDALTELPHGHPSRNVVEIIFQSSWSSDEFPGRVEMIYKVENGSRTVTRFEEYREVVKSRAGVNGDGAGACEEDVRCLADGNEMMRFYPLPDGINGGAWAFSGGKGQAVCTFSSSGEAHASSGGGGGRRAMLICRVIAGQVANRVGFGSDSVAGRDGMLNEKSDIYSFGVLLLEAVTGRDPVDYGRPANEVNLVEWLKMMVGTRRAEEVVDPRLEPRPSKSALKRALLVSLRCVDPEAEKRPRMSQVVRMLESEEHPFGQERRNRKSRTASIEIIETKDESISPSGAETDITKA